MANLFGKLFKNSKSNYISMKKMHLISKENKIEMKKLEKERKMLQPSDMFCNMKNEENILEIENLHVTFYTDLGKVKAVNGVTLEIKRGTTVGIVGESGCGKSVTSLSIMKLLRRPYGQITDGAIRFNIGNENLKAIFPKGMVDDNQQSVDLTNSPENIIRQIRGNQISMIFQEPMTTLNPVFTIGYQINEVLLLHKYANNKKEAMQKTKQLIKSVGIGNADAIYKKYPHELSGGMRQRIVIAMALACKPSLIIADEPTTALDVTIQAQVLDLLQNLKLKTNGAIMLITHDLGVVAEMADYVVIMYAGKVVEKGNVQEIFNNPLHPYTIGLMKSKPILNVKVDKLYNIPGNVPNPLYLPQHCYFFDRCEKFLEKCNFGQPELIQVSPTHYVACKLFNQEKIIKDEVENE